MKTPLTTSIATVIIALGLAGCNSSTTTSPAISTTAPTVVTTTTVVTPSLSSATLALGISAVPAELAKTYTLDKKFNRYTKYLVPNGKAIHIISQDKLSDNQIVRARSILSHYLKDYPGSTYGSDKSKVANKMADNGAILLLLNGSDDGKNPAGELDGQPLYQNEIQVEGGKWYWEQDYNHRDASFEEILHLVHDYGIGIDQGDSFNGALADYQTEIRNAQISALADKTWGGDR